MRDLEQAKQLLVSGGYTCVIYKDGEQFTSEQRGVRPLVLWLNTGCNFSGFSAADKVVGKATAFLYILLGVKNLYARVLSKPAFSVLETNGIKVEYEELVPNIINRSGTGMCPFEEVVFGETDPATALELILKKMHELQIPIS